MQSQPRRASGVQSPIRSIACLTLKLDQSAFVEEVGATVPPKPEGMAEILRWNQGRA